MSKEISGAGYALSKIFSSEFEYQIPSYQRPYSWTVEHASGLFEDLYDFYEIESEESYFLGSIVLIKKEAQPYSEVIDGQQRLTTLTMLFAAICSLAKDEYRKELQDYIMEPGKQFQKIEAKPRLTLRKKDKDFFLKYVQNINFEGLLSLDEARLENESQFNIKKNSEYFLEVLDNKFGDSHEQLGEFIQFLVMRCYLVAVSTPSQQSAFRVFSVINSRGLELQTTDIIKTDIIGAGC